MSEIVNERFYRGNAARLVLSMLLNLALFAVVASYGLLGDHWKRFLLFSLAAVLPVVVALAAFSAWANRFTFDDEAKCVVRPGRSPVPYGQVTAIFLNARGGTVDALIRRGWRGTAFLVEALPLSEQKRLEEGLAARFPGTPVRQTKWSTLTAALTLLVLVSALLAAGHAYLYRRTPQLALRPQAPAWERDEAVRKRPAHEYLEDFGFVLPPGVKLVTEQDTVQYFEDKKQKIRLKTVANIQRPELERYRTLFNLALGVRDYYELLDFSFRSRAGLVPVFLRSLELQGLEDASIVRLEPPLLRGFIIQGRRDDLEETHIVLMGDRPREEIHFFVTGPFRAPEKFIRTLVSGARLIGPGRT